MKTKTTHQLLGILLVILTMFSCGTEENIKPTNAELLAGNKINGKSYSIISAEIDLADVEGTLVLDQCVIDNTISYYPAGRYEENEGRTKCNVDDPPGRTGSWNLSSTEAYLIVEDGIDRDVWEIRNISENSHTITKETPVGLLTLVLSSI